MIRTVRLAAVVLLVLAVRAPVAMGGDRFGDDSMGTTSESAYRARRKGAIKSLGSVLRAVRKRVQGEVAGVKLQRRKGRLVYRVRVIQKNGRIRTVYVRAGSAGRARGKNGRRRDSDGRKVKRQKTRSTVAHTSDGAGSSGNSNSAYGSGGRGSGERNRNERSANTDRSGRSTGAAASIASGGGTVDSGGGSGETRAGSSGHGTSRHGGDDRENSGGRGRGRNRGRDHN